jgi:hypothetical protein
MEIFPFHLGTVVLTSQPKMRFVFRRSTAVGRFEVPLQQRLRCNSSNRGQLLDRFSWDGPLARWTVLDVLSV